MERRWVKRSQTEVIIATRRVLLNQPSREPQWCAACADAAPMVTLLEAASLAGVTPRAIYRWVEDGRLHFVLGGSPLVILLFPVGNMPANLFEPWEPDFKTVLQTFESYVVKLDPGLSLPPAG